MNPHAFAGGAREDGTDRALVVGVREDRDQ